MRIFASAFQVTDSGTEAPSIGDQVETAVEVTFDAVKMAATVGVGLVLGILAGLVITAVARMITRRGRYFEPVHKAISRRVQLLVAVFGAWMGFHYRLRVMPAEPPSWSDVLDHSFLIAIIVLTTWVLAGLVNGVTESVNDRMAETSEGRAARIKTQTQILRRVIVAVVWIVGVAGVLLTFPGARAAGASMLASAGIISVVAGLAAQTTLGNVFAGLQLAFTDSIRVGDIVMMEGNYTTVEEITLTYVVLAVWDGRRIIVPSSYMTTRPFENWTRRAPEMTGDVQISADWAVPIEAARLRLEQILEDTDLWDGRVGVMQVYDAVTNDRLVLRCLVSAENSPTLTDLRNYVREQMVLWIQQEAPQAIPHSRRYIDQKDDLEKQNMNSMALVQEREAAKPPVFEPEIVEPEVTDTSETEVISASAIAKFLRIPLAERTAKLDRMREKRVESGPKTEVKSAIFSGSREAEERAKAYSGPGDKAFAERKRKIEEEQVAKDEEQ